jgi:hypothetical protein
MLNFLLTNTVLLHNFYHCGSHALTDPTYSNFFEVSRMLLLKKGVMLCACIIFIIFLINFRYLIFYLIRSRAHNEISCVTWPTLLRRNFAPIIQPLDVPASPSSPFILPIVLYNPELSRIPSYLEGYANDIIHNTTIAPFFTHLIVSPSFSWSSTTRTHPLSLITTRSLPTDTYPSL